MYEMTERQHDIAMEYFTDINAYMTYLNLRDEYRSHIFAMRKAMIVQINSKKAGN